MAKIFLWFLVYAPNLAYMSSYDEVTTTSLTPKEDTCTKQEQLSLILRDTPEKTPLGPKKLNSDSNVHKIGKRQANKKKKKTAEELAAEAEKKRIDNVKDKSCNLMQQAMYASQELIWPLEPIFKKYETHVGYRMAYIFLKMRQTVADAKSILKTIEMRRYGVFGDGDGSNLWKPNMRLQFYWQLVKKNMDITYLVDYLKERVPLGAAGRQTTVVSKHTRSLQQRSHDMTDRLHDLKH